MNTLQALVILAQWTALLALGWAAHGLLRKAHPRWRVILWRGMLCAGLLVPVMPFIPVHVFQMPIYEMPAYPDGIPDALPPTATGTPTSTSQSAASLPPKPVEANNSVESPISQPQPHITRNIPWLNLILVVWGAIALIGALRLIWLQLQLNRLRRQSRAADPALQEQACHLQAKLGVRPAIDVRVSDSIVSSFACGLWKPAILIAQKLAGELPSDETSVLLAHEIAHFRRHDLFWCVGWRWMQALLWFHPLVWKIPAAHNLACEQESDRLASGQVPSDYMQLLARLAMRVLALPDVESRLVLNGASQIAERLNHLKRGKTGNWNWKYSMAGFGLVGLLFILATGCQISKNASPTADTLKNVKFDKVLVVVQDEDGQPIEGASIQPDGFRVKGIHGADAYNWKVNKSGPAEKVITDKDGKAWLKYPVMGIPGEKELTGALYFSVYHPEYCTTRIETFHVDGSDNPVQMERGISLEVSGYYGADREPVPEIVPNVNEEGARTNDWINEGDGVLSFHKLSPGDHLIQLMGRLPSGEIVYSDATAFTAEEGKPCKLELEMKPGIRLEGRLDDNVPRPVKNGRVLIAVRPHEFPAWNDYADVDDILKKYPNVYFWSSYRPIAADGTFVFESIPPGGLDVIVHGDGFVSKDGGQFQQHVGSKVKKINGFAVPQAFSLAAPVTKVEVITEPTATLELTAKTKSGKPIEGATVYVNPNVIRIGGIFGNVRQSSEEPFRKLESLPAILYSTTTDKNGVAIIPNIPADNDLMIIEDPQYQVPLQKPQGWRDRFVRITLSPGATNNLTMTLEPKGTDYIGSK